MKCVFLLIAISIFVCGLDAGLQRWGNTNGRELRRENVIAAARVNQTQIREVTYVSISAVDTWRNVRNQ